MSTEYAVFLHCIHISRSHLYYLPWVGSQNILLLFHLISLLCFGNQTNGVIKSYNNYGCVKETFTTLMKA